MIKIGHSKVRIELTSVRRNKSGGPIFDWSTRIILFSGNRVIGRFRIAEEISVLVVRFEMCFHQIRQLLFVCCQQSVAPVLYFMQRRTWK